MAQAIQAINNLSNQPLNVGAWDDIPGLSITILNGSGWIDVSWTATIQNTDIATQWAHLRLLVDNIEMVDARRTHDIPPTTRLSTASRILLKPGAGNHTYKLQGMATLGTCIIAARQMVFIVTEPGY